MTETMSAGAAVAGMIRKFDPAVATVLRGARTRMRRMLPTAIELVYDSISAKQRPRRRPAG